MLTEKVLFSEDETRKFVISGNRHMLREFSLGQLYSLEVFPFRKYFSNEKTKAPWTLCAMHTSHDKKITVSVWAANQ